jgi:hypothetical protein
MTHHAKVARSMGQDRKRYDRDNVVRETRKGQTFRKRHWKDPACNNGIRDRGLRQQLRGYKRIKNPGTRWQLCLKIKRTSEEFDRKVLGLEFMK